MGNKAFTLAEILITLGIIGIVAAMTLPAIIQKNNERATVARVKKIYSVMNQAILRSELDNGPKEYWEFPSETFKNIDWYKKYLSKYLNTVKVIETDINTQDITPIAIYFADGSSVIYGTTWLFFPEAKNMTNKKFGDDEDTIYADTSLSGIKWFTFEFSPKNNANPMYYKKGLVPYTYLWDGTREQLLTHPVFGCRQNISGTDERAYCTKLIQMNGWKVPKDYPLKF